MPEEPYTDEPSLLTTRRHPLPSFFHDEHRGTPFTHCLVCGCILDETTHYVTEKMVKTGRTVHQYAVCLTCCERMKAVYSSDSVRKIAGYFNAHVDMQQRQKELTADPDPSVNLSSWLSQCLVHKQPIHREDSYQACALCQGAHMLLGMMPFVISAEALEEIQLIISPKTRGQLDHFVDEFLDLPPEHAGSPNRPGLILV